jgi:hypothetical protein
VQEITNIPILVTYSSAKIYLIPLFSIFTYVISIITGTVIMNRKKQVRPFVEYKRGRLSFGTFIEIFFIIGLLNCVWILTLTFVFSIIGYTHVNGGFTFTTHLGISDAILPCIFEVLYFIAMGLILFPIYCFMIKRGWMIGPKIILPENGTEKESVTKNESNMRECFPQDNQ